MSDAVTLAWVGAGAVVASGLIGAGGVLVGVTLTARNERHRARGQRVHEDEQWQRAQRRDAYAGVLRASSRFEWCAVDYRGNHRGDPSNPMDYKLTAALEEAYLRLENATSDVMLLGSVTAARAAIDLSSHAAVVVGLLDRKGLSEKAWDEARKKLGKLSNGVLHAARRDLGVNPGEHLSPAGERQPPATIVAERKP